MNNRNIIIISVALGTLGIVFFLLLLFNNRITGLNPEEVSERLQLIPSEPVMEMLPAPNPEQLKTANLFHPLRGTPPPAPPTPEQQQQQAKPEPEPVKLNMLGGYPDGWPRLMLTGVFLSPRPGAIITGGNAPSYTSGTHYARIFYIGDKISGDIVLASVGERNAIIQLGNDALSIPLGVKPPDPPPKK